MERFGGGFERSAGSESARRQFFGSWGIEGMVTGHNDTGRNDGDTLAGMDDRFLRIRGRRDDVRWFDRAVLRLMDENVDVAHARSAFQEVLSALGESGESADELFGEPRAWADARIEQWREDGEDAFESQVLTMRDAVMYGLVSAVLFSVLMALGGLSGAAYSPMVAVAPLLMSVAAVGAVLVWRHAFRGFSRVVAFLLASLWALAGVAVIVGYALLTDWLNLPRLSSWLVMVPSAVVYAALLWLVSRYWKSTPAHRHDTEGLSSDDAAWLADLAGELRLRGDMGERRIRRIVGDAKRWARESSSGLEGEFGTAQAYAAGFKPSSLRELRIAWFWFAVVLLIDVPYLVVTWLGYAGRGVYSKAIAALLLVSGLTCLVASMISWWRRRRRC